MPVTISEACKKRKRETNTLTYSRFAADETAMDFGGCFRDNIREFLAQCSNRQDYTVGTHPVWCTSLVNDCNGVVFRLYIVEETVENSSSSQSPCDFCRLIGWGHHFVSKRNYHFIIPDDCKLNKPLKKQSLKLQTHLLHGVIHCNGFGHLLCVKSESNSNNLPGEDLMNLWDRLCTSLLTRDISMYDLSKKGPMELRLLYGVACSRSWFGKWGYKLSHGSFGITKQDYNRALEILSSLDLTMVISNFAKKTQGKSIEQIIQSYRDISETQLETLSELFKFMLTFESKPTKTTLAHESKSPLGKRQSLASFVAAMEKARWPARRLEHVVKAAFEIIEAHGTKMVREELRNAIREHIGDTGLIDFVLKHINNVTLGNQIIIRESKTKSKLLEFSLEDISESAQNSESEIEMEADTETELNAYKDLLLLYKQVLLGYPEYHAVKMAVRTVLDSKHFVKKPKLKTETDDSSLRLTYQVRPSYNELVNELIRPLPPSETALIPEVATLGELKIVLQKALRDTYCIMDQYVVEDIEIGELQVVGDEKVLQKGGVREMEVRVRGHGMDLDTRLRYQGGDNEWIVKCKCRVKEDDGERMVACNVCQVRQHTRCNGISDNDDFPDLFLCRLCSNRVNKSGKR